MVPGGLEVMSYTTLETPRTSLTILLETFARTSKGILDQSAVVVILFIILVLVVLFSQEIRPDESEPVIKSVVSTLLKAMTCWYERPSPITPTARMGKIAANVWEVDRYNPDQKD